MAADLLDFLSSWDVVAELMTVAVVETEKAMTQQELYFSNWDLGAQWTAAISAAVAAVGAGLAVVFTYLAWQGQKVILATTQDQVNEAKDQTSEAKAQTAEARRQADLAQTQANMEQIQLEIAEERRKIDRDIYQERRRSQSPFFTYVKYNSGFTFSLGAKDYKASSIAGNEHTSKLIKDWYDSAARFRMFIVNAKPAIKLRELDASFQGSPVTLEKCEFTPGPQSPKMAGWLLTMPLQANTHSDIVFNFETETGYVDRHIYNLVAAMEPPPGGTVAFKRIDPVGIATK